MAEKVPETRPFLEERYGLPPGGTLPVVDTYFDLWGNLLDALTRQVLQPALLADPLDEDLLRRCFDVVEVAYATLGDDPGGTVYFTVLESLLDAEGYLANAVPFLRGPVRDRTSKMCRTYEVEGYETGLPPL
ncbi:hypothetical protein [Streptomyces sp. NPDC002082]|uniref:hypothetical protein n=1 Tax=Streptomyces sp. NPDC002082 TaxID=3154772 RepID=UPI00332C14A6